MIIRSEDGRSEIELELNYPQDQFSDFTFVVRGTDDLCSFSGCNDGVVLERYAGFLDSLQELIANRDGKAVLNMSEDCKLIFFRWSAVGDVGVKATVTKFGVSTDTYKADKYCTEFEFKIDGEFLNSLLEGFKELAPWG